VVSHNTGRADKRLFTDSEEGGPVQVYEAVDERDEAQYVVRQVLETAREEGRSFGEFAVFYRTNAQSRPIEEALLEHDLPYTVVGGVRFYERAEVKDALAYVRSLLNPSDGMALRRIVNSPPRGIGRTTVERAEQRAAEEGIPLLEAFRALSADAGTGRAAARIREFLGMHDALAAEVPGLAPAEALARVLDRSGYLAHLERQANPEAEGRLENLRELLAGAEDFASANAGAEEDRSALELFLDQVALVSDLDAWEDRSARVSLMTAHTAKGLEFPIVFLVGLEEGVLPHAASSRDVAGVEEERRLCYVGMTRAMERLHLTCASERRRYGARTFCTPSRFLSEIPSEWVQGGTARPAPSRGDTRHIDYAYGQDGGDEGDGLAPGLRVRHPIFGEGTVTDVSGAGAGRKLRVRFDRVGVKTVLLRFANLEPA